MNPAPPLPVDHVDAALKLGRRTLRYGWRGFIALLLGVAVTLAVLALKPKHYTSAAVLYYQEGFQWDMQGDGSRRAGQRLRDMVLARSRLQQVVAELGLFPALVRAGKMDDALEEMRRRTTFRVNEGDTFVVSFVADSPHDAQLVTSTLAQSLISDNARLRSEQLALAKTFLDAQRKRTHDALRQKEAELARFLGSHPELGDAGLIAIGVPGGLRGSVPPQVGQPSPVPLPAATAAPRADPRAELVAAEQQAQAHLLAARRELASQLERFTERHPAVVAATALVSAAEAAHQRALQALAAAGPARAPADAPRQVPAGRSPRIRVETLEEHARLTRELGEERERFQQLDARQFVASMAANSFAGGHSAQISIVDPAFLPVRPTGASTKILLLAGLAGSLALGFATALLFALLDDRVYDRRDVEAWGRAPVLTEVLQLPATAPPPSRATEAARGGATVEISSRGALLGVGNPPLRLAAGTTDGPSPPAPGGGEPSARAGGALALHAAAGPISLADPTRLAEIPDPFATSASAGGDGPQDEAVDPRLVLLRAPDSGAAASFRILRHRLAERGGPRCILVTSPGVGEGKTTCSLNLALALSESGRANVLLLDANFRRPALGTILRTRSIGGAQRGPSEVHTAGPWGVIEHVTPWLAFSGISPTADPRLVDGLSMRMRLEELGAADYDCIVIDGPHVLGSADINLLQESASGVLLTMWSRRSRASSLRKAMDQIGSRKVLGVVLMGA